MNVTLQNLTKRYPSRNKADRTEVIAVNDFTFEAPDGKMICLLGPSGCGKSTTLNMISGLEKPTSGKIFFGEDDVTGLPPEHRGIGLVFQNYALYPHMTVRQNILFPLQNLKGEAKLTRAEMEERVNEAANLVQIQQYMNRKPAQLSGGQQQRVAIARALVKLPRILLLDEPLSNLDARLRLQTREELRKIQQKTGITTFFVTHDQDEAMSISDVIVVMKTGVLQQTGSPQEVYDDPVNLFVATFLGTPPINLFTGNVRDGALYLGEDRIARVSSLPDQEVTVGIRPEGFIPDPDGPLHCSLQSLEVMGRDTTILSSHPAFQGTSIRSIVSSEDTVDLNCKAVSFRIKPAKLFLFQKDSGERIRVIPEKG